MKAAFDSLCAELSSVANLRIEHSKWLVEQLAKPVCIPFVTSFIYYFVDDNVCYMLGYES